jgi:hypothetical protein
MKQGVEWYNDPRIHTLFTWQKDDTPITMSRNAAIEAAKECGADFVLMVDSDMCPDTPVAYGIAQPFWKSSFDFALAQRAAGKPCCVGAPYCGPPPHENIYVFLWRNVESNCPDSVRNMALCQYTRDDAARMTGIREVAALPTGLIIIDMQGMKRIAPPYFYYEFNEPLQSKKQSTEDVTFTRDLSIRGVPQFCNWDAWAGHWKWKCVGKPEPITSAWVSDKIKQAVMSDFNINRGEALVDVHEIRPGPIDNGHAGRIRSSSGDRLTENEALATAQAAAKNAADHPAGRAPN